jgi:hypothetical protein
MIKWAYDNIIVKELPIGYMFLTQQTGAPMYCSEGAFEDQECRRMIG